MPTSTHDNTHENAFRARPHPIANGDATARHAHESAAGTNIRTPHCRRRTNYGQHLPHPAITPDSHSTHRRFFLAPKAQGAHISSSWFHTKPLEQNPDPASSDCGSPISLFNRGLSAPSTIVQPRPNQDLLSCYGADACCTNRKRSLPYKPSFPAKTRTFIFPLPPRNSQANLRAAGRPRGEPSPQAQVFPAPCAAGRPCCAMIAFCA